MIRGVSLWLLVILIGLTSCTQPVEADNNESNEVVKKADAVESVATVPSIIFIQYLNQQAPQLLCEQDATVQCMSMPAELCIASVEESVTRCGPELLKQWPASFEENADNAQKYANAYRQCIFNDWIVSFGLDAKRLETCGVTVTP